MASSFAVVLSVLSAPFASSDQISSSDSGRFLSVWRKFLFNFCATCQRRFFFACQIAALHFCFPFLDLSSTFCKVFFLVGFS